MAFESGTIVDVRENRVLVEASPNEACGACSAKESCLMGDTSKMRKLWMHNGIGAARGDRVEFSIGEGTVVGISLLFYFLPVLFLIGGILFGLKANRFFHVDSEPGSVIFGIVGLVFSVLVIKLVSGRVQKRKSFQPILIKVINSIPGDHVNSCSSSEVMNG